MRLDDINAFIDVKRAYERLANRLDGVLVEDDVQFMRIDDLRKAATVTDSSIQREPMVTCSNTILSFTYRGVKFWHMASEGEVL